MPEKNDPQQDFLRDVERNDKGQFRSKSQQADILKRKTAELNAQLQKQSALIEKLQKQQSKTPKFDAVIVKGLQAQIKMFQQQTKSAEQAHKSYEKMQKNVLKYQDKLMRGHMKMQKAMAKRGGSGEQNWFEWLGSGWKLPAFLSVAAITAATKSWIDFTVQLGNAAKAAQAFGMGRDMSQMLPYKRDQELFSHYAQQRFSNRFSGETEIRGLKNLRDSLTKALGEDFGKELTAKITNSLKLSEKELRKFLAMASKDVPAALRAFESADIENMATALSAVTMRMDELGGAATAVEAVWRDIREIGEDMAKIIAPAIKDIVEWIHSGTQAGSDFRTTLIDVAESGVKGLYSLGEAFKESYGSLLTFNSAMAQASLLWEELKHPGVVGAIGSGKKQLEDKALEDHVRGVIMRAREASAAARDFNKPDAGASAARQKQLDEWFGKLRQSVAGMTPALEASTAAANAQGMGTAAERAQLAEDRLREALTLQGSQLKVLESGLNAAESSPFGFADAYELRLEAVNKLNEQAVTLQQQLQAINSRQADSEEQLLKNKLDALQVETEINETILKRNYLLRETQKGYLSAVVAASTASGRFEKTIIGQDKNVGKALQSGMVKANPLLGQIGNAGNVAVEPFRFGTNQSLNIQGLNRYKNQLARHMGNIDAGNPIVPQSPIQSSIQVAMAQAHTSQERQNMLRNQNVNRGGSSFTRKSDVPGITDLRKGIQLMGKGVDEIEDVLNQIGGRPPEAGRLRPSGNAIIPSGPT